MNKINGSVVASWLVRWIMLAPVMLILSILIALIMLFTWNSFKNEMGGNAHGFMLEKGKPVLVTINAAVGRKATPIPGADAATFKALDHQKDAKVVYALDSQQAYIAYKNSAMIVDRADPASFSIHTSDGTYSMDKQRVYWYGVELPGADPGSFKIIQAPYAIDAKRAYAGTTPVEVESLEKFQVLDVHYATRPIIGGRNGLEVRERKETGISGWSRDGSHYFWGVIKLERADYNSVTILNETHAKDSSRVYFRGEPIQGADAASFETVSPGVISGRDEDYEYELGKRAGPRK
jgi:hypothetical protein